MDITVQSRGRMTWKNGIPIVVSVNTTLASSAHQRLRGRHLPWSLCRRITLQRYITMLSIKLIRTNALTSVCYVYLASDTYSLHTWRSLTCTLTDTVSTILLSHHMAATMHNKENEPASRWWANVIITETFQQSTNEREAQWLILVVDAQNIYDADNTNMSVTNARHILTGSSRRTTGHGHVWQSLV